MTLTNMTDEEKIAHKKALRKEANKRYYESHRERIIEHNTNYYRVERDKDANDARTRWREAKRRKAEQRRTAFINN